VNKNPVAERAVQELIEHVRLDLTARVVTPVLLVLAVALNPNHTIWQSGVSVHEVFLQRDQFTDAQPPLSDRDILINKQSLRTPNYVSTESPRLQMLHVHILPSNPSTSAVLCVSKAMVINHVKETDIW
jgi:hypothetical protein